ncbi:cellulose biosynthesis protein BcsF [Nocardia sp. CA-128927]
MEIVGIVATAVVAVIVLGAAYLGVRSVPDIRRYLKMRHM